MLHVTVELFYQEISTQVCISQPPEAAPCMGMLAQLESNNLERNCTTHPVNPTAGLESKGVTVGGVPPKKDITLRYNVVKIN